MATRLDSYSRMVAWLKVVLPLTALGLLSTLFLLSRSVSPTSTIPFADTEIEERLRNQQITEPIFAGTTEAGDQISLTASTVRPSSQGAARPEAEDLHVEIALIRGGKVTLSARKGELDLGENVAILRDSVTISNSQGYQVKTEQLRTNMSRVEAETPGSVTATGPLGQLEAGRMKLQADDDGDNVQMVFTNGVKLLYDPKQTER
jgi:lipopolysaccharide export system protein LptC